MYEIGYKKGRLSTLYSRNQFVITNSQRKISGSRWCATSHNPQTKIFIRATVRKLSNLSGEEWGLRTTTDLRIYKNVKHRSAKFKAAKYHRNEYNATISYLKIKMIKYYIFLRYYVLQPTWIRKMRQKTKQLVFRRIGCIVLRRNSMIRIEIVRHARFKQDMM